MASKQRVNVVWFKCTDLRTHDHAPLRAAHDSGLPIVHLFVFDPFWYAGTTRICGFPKTGVLRTRFHLEALNDLAVRLSSHGHALCTRRHISTSACFEELCEDFVVENVYAFHEICSEELRIEHQVRETLRRKARGRLHLFWGFELYHRDDLDFDPARARGPFNSYTSFRRRLEDRSSVRWSQHENPSFRSGQGSSATWHRADVSLPTVQEVMGARYRKADDPGEEKDPRAEIRWKGGETAALERVQKYIWDDENLSLDYVGATMTTDPSKSCMRDKAMSKLSPWLAHGCLSPRLLYEEVKRYECQRRKNKSTYWITHELLWRDFVRFGSIQAGNSIFKIGGIHNQHPVWRWSTDRDMLSAWVEGRTGFPFVDCFMRELAATGYCNHMGRECSGWFLIGDLGLDWRMGAEWFESVLLDYEPTANWYNWTYRCLPAAARGPGEKLQGIEILKWGTQHDPDATYIKRWIPALASLSPTVAREPWRLWLLSEGGSQQQAPPRALRASPTGKFQVNQEALATVLSMGFEKSEAAIALHRTWDDPEAAISLILSEREGTPAAGAEEDEVARAIQMSLQSGDAPAQSSDPIEIEDGSDTEDAQLAQAMRLSMKPPRTAEQRDVSNQEHGSTDVHDGVHYPMPIIRPVSLRSAEESEAHARSEQLKRDQQIAATRRKMGTFREDFNKAKWEAARQQRPAETPTSAGASWRARTGQPAHLGYQGHGATRAGGKGRGKRFQASDNDTMGSGSYEGSGYAGASNHSGKDRKRRWGGRGPYPEDEARGG